MWNYEDSGSCLGVVYLAEILGQVHEGSLKNTSRHCRVTYKIHVLLPSTKFLWLKTFSSVHSVNVFLANGRLHNWKA